MIVVAVQAILGGQLAAVALAAPVALIGCESSARTALLGEPVATGAIFVPPAGW